MKKFRILLLLIFIFCGSGYFNDSYLDDYESALENLGVEAATIQTALEDVDEICSSVHSDLNYWINDGSLIDVDIVQASFYTNARRYGASPQNAQLLHESLFGLCDIRNFINDFCPGCFITRDIRGLENYYLEGY